MLHLRFRAFRAGFWLALVAAGLLTPTGVRAQTPSWQTLLALAGNGNSVSTTATTLDAAGNLYMVGTFTGSLTFGANTLSSAGLEDIYVAKYSLALGGLQWLQRAGGAGADVATGVVVNSRGVFVTGYFNGATSTLGATVLTGTGATTAFVTRLTDSGNAGSFAWAYGLGGPGGSRALGVAANGASVYVAGDFTDTISSSSQSLGSAGGTDGFLTRLTDAGPTATFDWLTALGGPQNDGATGVAVQGSSLYVVGSFSGQATLGSIPVISNGGTDLYVTKLTDIGALSTSIWAQTGGSSLTDDYATAVATQGTGVYVTGSFGSTTALGAFPLTSAGGMDGFVTKLTDVGATGSFSWARRLGGPAADQATAVAVRGTAVYVAGQFSGTASGFGTTSLTSAGLTDLFVARFTDQSTISSVNWAQQAGGSAADAALSVAVNSTGRVYTAGRAGVPASFGPLSISTAGALGAGFVASFLDPIPTATAAAAAPLALSIYPNPARTTVQVPGATRATTLTLLDAVGRPVRQGSGSALSVRDVVPGLYVLRAATPGQPARTARLVVE